MYFCIEIKENMVHCLNSKPEPGSINAPYFSITRLCTAAFISPGCYQIVNFKKNMILNLSTKWGGGAVVRLRLSSTNRL